MVNPMKYTTFCYVLLYFGMKQKTLIIHIIHGIYCVWCWLRRQVIPKVLQGVQDVHKYTQMNQKAPKKCVFFFFIHIFKLYILTQVYEMKLVIRCLYQMLHSYNR